MMFKHFSAASPPDRGERALRVAAPFNTAVYEEINSWHPLFETLYASGSSLDFFEAASPEPMERSIEGAIKDAKALSVYLTEKTLSNRAVALSDIHDFIDTRDLMSQALIPKNVDLTFHHTSPVTFGQTPWILHIETVTTLFHPFLQHGRAAGLKLREQPVYWLVRALLEREEFRVLSTHMKMTEEAVHSVFRSNIISSKVRYIPLGVSFSEETIRRIDEAVESKHGHGGVVNILFTNSWHRQPVNFYNRGGQEVIYAFLEARKKIKDIRLTILSTFPEEFRETELYKEALEHPDIKIIDRWVSDEELLELLVEASVFLLPSAGLHSISLLKAMGSGAVCVVSDAPGFSEFIERGRNGLVVKGIKDRIYSTDAETGWQRDDYSTMRTLNIRTAESLMGEIVQLCSDPGSRKRIALNAIRDVRKRSGTEFRYGFEAIAATAAERGAAPPPGLFEVKPASPAHGRVGKKDDEAVKLIDETPLYNIVRSGPRFVAVARGLGRVDLFREKLGEREIRPLILLGDSEDGIRKSAASANLVIWNIMLVIEGLFRLISPRLGFGPRKK